MALTDKQKTAIFGFEDEKKVLLLSQIAPIKRSEILANTIRAYEKELLQYPIPSSEEREIQVQLLCVKEMATIMLDDWQEVTKILNERNREYAEMRNQQAQQT